MSVTAYLVAAMLAWTPARVHPRLSGESEIAATERYDNVASDVVRVACLDKSEPPIYPEPNARLRTALWLVAQAKCESEFSVKVDRGNCPKGQCDHGSAWGLWQIHPNEGLTYEGIKFLRYASRPLGWVGIVFDGPALTADRSQGARMALHLRRVSKYLWMTWQCAEELERKWSKTTTPAWCAP